MKRPMTTRARRGHLAGALFIFCVTALIAPVVASAGVAGQQEAWKTPFGTEPGELFSPRSLGVDPVDGSVYIANIVPEEPELRIDKFSATGKLEGTMLVSRTPTTSNPEELPAGFIGIAVDHELGRFYLVKDEIEVDKREGAETRVATEVLAFSTNPQGGKLVPAAIPSFPLPAANGSDTLFGAQEVAVDPSNHEIVLAARTPTGKAVLARFSPAGVPGPRYEEQGAFLRQFAGEFFTLEQGNYGFAIAPDGTTDIVAQVAESGSEVRGFSLPPNFASGLTPLPDFAATAKAEGWGEAEGALRIFSPQNGTGRGPQVALTIATDGEETLLWKSGPGTNSEEEAANIVLHGYSLKQHQTTAAYGGGTVKGRCAIQSTSAAIAATKGGNVVVLDQGPPFSSQAEAPSFGLSVLRFGRIGALCPAPAALTRLKAGGSEVSSVVAGTKVTLDATGSELGTNLVSKKPNVLRGLTWTIEGPGGKEEIPVTGKTPSESLEHEFATAGEYTIRLDLQTDPFPIVGTSFAAKPVKLKVTESATAPSVTSISPSHGAAAGGVVVAITGTRLSGATGVKFEGVAATNVEAVSATEVKATSPACTPGSTAHVTVTTGGGTSGAGPGDLYTCDGSGQPAPIVVEVSPNRGPAAGGTVVAIKGANLSGAAGVKFGSKSATEVTPVSSTELKATSPAGSGEVDVVVITGGGASFTSSADKFSYDSSPTHAFSVVRAGSGAGSISCNGVHCETSYPIGSVVTLTALASNGSTFLGWSGGRCSGVGSCTVTIDENLSVTAAFNLVGAPPVTPVTKSSAARPPSGGSSKPAASSTSEPAKTKAQIIAENRKKALLACKKLKGKPKAICVKRANQVGKEPKKPVKEFGAEESAGKKHSGKKHDGKDKAGKKPSAKKSKS